MEGTNAVDPVAQSVAYLITTLGRKLGQYSRGWWGRTIQQLSTTTSPARQLWSYDFRTNQNFTLKTRALVRADLDDFVACYSPANRHERTETERFRAFSYDELAARDKASLDIFWLRDESLEDSGNCRPRS